MLVLFFHTRVQVKPSDQTRVSKKIPSVRTTGPCICNFNPNRKYVEPEQRWQQPWGPNLTTTRENQIYRRPAAQSMSSTAREEGPKYLSSVIPISGHYIVKHARLKSAAAWRWCDSTEIHGSTNYYFFNIQRPRKNNNQGKNGWFWTWQLCGTCRWHAGCKTRRKNDWSRTGFANVNFLDSKVYKLDE